MLQETKDDSTDYDTSLSADEEGSPSKRRTISPKNNTQAIIIPCASTSQLTQRVAVSNNNFPVLHTPSEILETNVAVCVQTPEITTIRQPIASDLQLKGQPLLLRQIQTADSLNIQSSNIKTQLSSNSQRIIYDKMLQQEDQ